MVMDKERIKEFEESIKKRVPGGAKVIEQGTKFEFKCRACGNCCSNETIDEILLSPFDLYNIAKALDMEVKDVVNKYTNYYVGGSSRFVIVRIDGDIYKDNKGNTIKLCPFLKDRKCSIHIYKPSTCRLFPLGRAVMFDKSTNSKDMIYFLQNANCGDKGEFHTIEDWIPDREDYEKMLDIQSDIIVNLKNILNIESMMEKAEKDNRMKELLSILFQGILSIYYCNYNTNEPFFEQLDKNIEMLKDVYEKISLALD